jgi:ABC-2 type transport system permease protein
MKTFADSWFLTVRGLRHLIRQPFYVAFTLIQPIVWLVLYGQLFQRVVELPGFHGVSYISFLTPGIVIMSALFSSGWNGMGMIHEMDAGVLDRFLIAPVSRVALLISRLYGLAIITTIQSSILFALGAILGARYPGGLPGLLVLLISAILMAVPFAALSCALALVVRKEESVIGAVNFILLPLTFLSPVFMANTLMPRWMQIAARFNPVRWSVEAGRAALNGQSDPAGVLVRWGLLLAFGCFATWIATRAFRSYQSSA